MNNVLKFCVAATAVLGAATAVVALASMAMVAEALERRGVHH